MADKEQEQQIRVQIEKLSLSDKEDVQRVQIEDENGKEIEFDQNVVRRVENLELHKAINKNSNSEYDKESPAPLLTIYKQFAESFIETNTERDFNYFSFQNNGDIKQILSIINPKLVNSQNFKEQADNQRGNTTFVTILKIINVHLSTKKMMEKTFNGNQIIQVDYAQLPFRCLVQQIMLNYIFEIQHKQSDQIVHNALILIQGEWQPLNSFLYAVVSYNLQVSVVDEVQKPKKVVFINLCGYDTINNHQFWNDKNNQLSKSKAIYISFVLNEEFLEENDPSQRKYIIPLKMKPNQDPSQNSLEIEYIFEEFFNDIIEGAHSVFLQLGVNNDLQLNQSVVQNIVYRLNQLTNQKLIVQIQYIKHDSVLSGSIHFMEIYQAVLQGIQGPSAYQNLPSLFNHQSNYWENLGYICEKLRNTKQKKLVKIIHNLLIDHQNMKIFKLKKTIGEESKADGYAIANLYIQNQIIQIKIRMDQFPFQIVEDTKEYINYQSGIIFYQNLKLFHDKENKNNFKFIDAFAQMDKINQSDSSVFLQVLKWRQKRHTSIFIKNKVIYRNYGMIDNEFIDAIDVYDTQTNQYFEFRRNENFKSSYSFVESSDQSVQFDQSVQSEQSYQSNQSDQYQEIIVDIIKHRKGGTCVEFGNGYFIVGGSPINNPQIMNIIEVIEIGTDGQFGSTKIKKGRLKLKDYYGFYPFEQNIVLRNQNTYLIMGSNNYLQSTPYLLSDDSKSHKLAFLIKFDDDQNIKFLNLTVQDESKMFFILQEKSENWVYLEDQNCWLVIQKKHVKNVNPNNQQQQHENASQQFLEKMYNFDSNGKLKRASQGEIDVEEKKNASMKHSIYEEYLVLSKIYVHEGKKSVVIKTESFSQSNKQYDMISEHNETST